MGGTHAAYCTPVVRCLPGPTIQGESAVRPAAPKLPAAFEEHTAAWQWQRVATNLYLNGLGCCIVNDNGEVRCLAETRTKLGGRI